MMIQKNSNDRFVKRLEHVFWWILRLFPLICLVIQFFGMFRSAPFWQYFIDDGFDFSLLSVAFDFIDVFCALNIESDNFIIELLTRVFGTDGFLPFFDTYTSPFLFYYIAWIVSVEFMRFFYNFTVFIIRWTNSLFEKWGR